MSYGHGRSNAGIETPHGEVSADCVLAWVRCDGCGHTLAAVGGVETEGNALCDALASGEGWTQDDDGRDLCAGCPARKDTR